jgi:hypothetical protein
MRSHVGDHNADLKADELEPHEGAERAQAAVARRLSVAIAIRRLARSAPRAVTRRPEDLIHDLVK